MSTLSQLIANTPDALTAAQAGDWSACAAALNAATVQRTDATLRTANWLSLELAAPMPGGQPGETKADRVLGTLVTVGAQKPMVLAAYHSLCNQGINLSLPLVQDMILQLGQLGQWGDALIADVRSRGVWYVSPAAEAGLDTATAEACETAWTKRVRDIAVASVMNEHVNPAVSGDTTKAQVAAAFRAAADELDA